MRVDHGCGYVLLRCQHRQEAFNFGLPHVARMLKPTPAAGRPQYKCLGPVDISFLGQQAVAQVANALAHPIWQLDGPGSCSVKF